MGMDWQSLQMVTNMKEATLKVNKMDMVHTFTPVVKSKEVNINMEEWFDVVYDFKISD